MGKTPIDRRFAAIIAVSDDSSRLRAGLPSLHPRNRLLEIGHRVASTRVEAAAGARGAARAA